QGGRGGGANGAVSVANHSAATQSLIQTSTITSNVTQAAAGGNDTGGGQGGVGGVAEGGGILVFNTGPQAMVIAGNTVANNTLIAANAGTGAVPALGAGEADGGGIAAYRGVTQIYDSTIVGNTASTGAGPQTAYANGGGVAAIEGSTELDLFSDTIANNSV